MQLPRAMAPLRHAGFRLLVAGQLSSNIGDLFYAVALPWYVLATHGGALLLGTVLAAYGIPRTVLVTVGGHFADRFRPWTVMMLTDTVRALALGALTVIAASGPAHAGLLIPVAIVIGGAEGLFLPSSFAIVPSLLPGEELQAGNAITSSGTQLATLLGPALGGAVIALVGPTAGFGVDAASFVVSAVTLAGIRAHQRVPAVDVVPVRHGGSDLAPSPESAAPTRLATLVETMRSARGFQVALIVTVAANLGSGGLSEVALPALARGPFAAGAGGYGILLAAFGGGALIGTLIAAQMPQSKRPAVTGSVAFLVDAAFTAFVPYLGGVAPAAALLAILGLCNGFGNVIMITAFQRWAPAHLIGRLSGLLTLASFGIFPVSVLLGGFIVHADGPAVFFPLAAAVLALAVAAGLSQRSWRDFGALPPGEVDYAPSSSRRAVSAATSDSSAATRASSAAFAAAIDGRGGAAT